MKRSFTARVVRVLGVVFLFGACQPSTKEHIQLIFVGDLLLDRGVRERIEHHGIDYLFHASVNSVFTEADLVVANLECPVTKWEEPHP